MLFVGERPSPRKLGRHRDGFLAEIREQVEQLYLESREDVYYYLVTLGLAPGSAQETCQEVFLRLYREIRDGAQIENPRAWAFRVAHNLGLKVRARERIVHPLESDGIPSAHPAETSNPERFFLESERLMLLRQAVSELSPQQRQCLHLRAEGLRYNEIAQMLGISVSSVNEFLRRAIRKLRKVVHA